MTDFKVKEVDVQLGVGYGFTPGSDRLTFKAIIGYAFPSSPASNDSGSTQGKQDVVWIGGGAGAPSRLISIHQNG